MLNIEKTIEKCKSKEDVDFFMQNHIPEKYQQYFKWTTHLKCIEKDITKIDEYLAKLGYFVIATNETADKMTLLEYYRNRDRVEKIFDVLKNEMDGSRLRVHSSYNTDGKMFVKFIAMIIYMKIAQQMKKAKLFDKLSLREMLREFKKIKITHIEHFEPIISELTKKTKKLFADLKMEPPS